MSILLKVLLFQLSGRGNPHDDASPNFISDSISCISGLSNELSFVSEFLLKGGQNSQNVCLKTWGGGCLFSVGSVVIQNDS